MTYGKEKNYNFKRITRIYMLFFFLISLPNFNYCNEHISVVRCFFLISVLVPTTMTNKPYGTHPVPKQNLVEFEEFNTATFMSYDNIEAPVSKQENPFLNQLVYLVAHTNGVEFKKGEVIATGIFIDYQHVLSSYNPYRVLRREIGLSKMNVYFNRAYWYEKGKLKGYFVENRDFACARQVFPLDEDYIRPSQWHGPEYLHCPMHDLLVFQTKNDTNEAGALYYVDGDIEMKNNSFDRVGPLVTRIAGAYDWLPEKLQFVSLALTDDDMKKNHVRVVDVDTAEDKVLMDCDEWFIRDWGYFFCINTKDDDHLRLGSGAFLYSPESGIVFGVGSFYLRKGKESIMVFTDVRRYEYLIFETCSE